MLQSMSMFLMKPNGWLNMGVMQQTGKISRRINREWLFQQKWARTNTTQPLFRSKRLDLFSRLIVIHEYTQLNARKQRKDLNSPYLKAQYRNETLKKHFVRGNIKFRSLCCTFRCVEFKSFSYFWAFNRSDILKRENGVNIMSSKFWYLTFFNKSQSPSAKYFSFVCHGTSPILFCFNFRWRCMMVLQFFSWAVDS